MNFYINLSQCAGGNVDKIIFIFIRSLLPLVRKVAAKPT